MAENKRISRELNKREVTKRPSSWNPANTLPVPQEEDNKVFRWIRKAMLGVSDPTNFSKKQREGWEPVRAEDYPELKLSIDEDAKNSGLIEVGGLILCRMPKEFADQRAKYYGQHAHQQMEAVDSNFMKENDPRMPLFKERNSKVSFGKG